MNILVTGGNGFIGSHLVRKLRDRLAYEGDGVVDSMDVKISQNHDIRQFSNCSVGVLGRDVVVHLAAVSRTPEATGDPSRAYQTNVVGTMNLLEAVRRINPKCRFVHISSNIVYGNSNHYRASKLMAEELVRTYTQTYHLNSIILRYSNVYGAGMPWTDSICLASMRRSKHENGYITLSGDGSQSRDFTHVADIVAGTIRAIHSKVRGPDDGGVDLCTGVNTSMKEMARYFDCPIQYGPARPGDTQHIFQKATDGRVFLDWESTIPVESGISDVLEDVPDHYKLSGDRVQYNSESLDTVEAGL